MSNLPIECQELLVSGYVLGNLSPAEASLFVEMLAETPELSQQVTAMQQALDLTYNPPEIAPPVGLRDRLLTKAEAQINPALVKSSNDSNLKTAKVLPFKLPQVLGAIALMAIAALGIANYRLWQTVKARQIAPNSEISESTYLLQGQGENNLAQVKLKVNPQQLKASLNASNLPPLPSDKVYALWTVVGKDVPYTTDVKGAILTAVFQVDEAGNFKHDVALPQPHLEPRTVQKLAITVEDIKAPQAHAGSIFIATPDRS